MNKLNLYLAVLLMIFLANCGGSNESETEYEKLLQKSDTLEKRNSHLAEALDTVRQSHGQLTQQLESMSDVDTAWLEKLAKHEVVLKNQQVTLEKNRDIFKNHKEFSNKRDQVTKEEFQAQISEMKQGHSEISNELDQIKSQQQMISDEHKSIREELMNKQQDNQSSM